MRNPFYYLNETTPGGRQVHRPAWQVQRSGILDAEQPFYVRFDLAWRKAILIFCLVAAILGLLGGLTALSACAIAFLVMLHLENQSAFDQLDAMEIKNFTAPGEICERETLTLCVDLVNSSPKKLVNIVAEASFSGSTRPRQYHLVREWQKGAKITLKFAFPADCGMGEYPPPTLTLAAGDPLGFGCYGFTASWPAGTTVLPEEINLSAFQVHSAGQALHGGSHEIAKAGRSQSFLGLREWRNGDAIAHIDWKRSVRTHTLLVKEFEAIAAIDATIIMEDTAVGHSRYKAVSSQESLRDSLIAISRRLCEQQIRQQFVASNISVPYGVGLEHFSAISRAILSLPFQSHERITDLLKQSIEEIPPDSVCILALSSCSIDIEALLAGLSQLEDKQVDYVLLVIDSESFAAHVGGQANIDPAQYQMIHGLLQREDQGNAHIRRLIAKILARTYWIGPGQTIVDVYDQSMGV